MSEKWPCNKVECTDGIISLKWNDCNVELLACLNEMPDECRKWCMEKIEKLGTIHDLKKQITTRIWGLYDGEIIGEIYARFSGKSWFDELYDGKKVEEIYARFLLGDMFERNDLQGRPISERAGKIWMSDRPEVISQFHKANGMEKYRCMMSAKITKCRTIQEIMDVFQNDLYAEMFAEFEDATVKKWLKAVKKQANNDDKKMLRRTGGL